MDRRIPLAGYFPYGKDRGIGPTDTVKFATYTRDSISGLDYADQRIHSPGIGRFTTPDDSYENEAGDRPFSWNQYSYVEGDPTNFNDPTGTFRCGDLQLTSTGQSLRSLVTGTSETALLAQMMWHEAGPMYSTDDYQSLRDEELWIGTAMENRLAMSNGFWSLTYHK